MLFADWKQQCIEIVHVVIGVGLEELLSAERRKANAFERVVQQTYNFLTVLLAHELVWVVREYIVSI